MSRVLRVVDTVLRARYRGALVSTPENLLGPVFQKTTQDLRAPGEHPRRLPSTLCRRDLIPQVTAMRTGHTGQATSRQGLTGQGTGTRSRPRATPAKQGRKQPLAASVLPGPQGFCVLTKRPSVAATGVAHELPGA